MLAALLGHDALIASATGTLIGAGLLLPMILFGWVGAGDALLLGAIGAWDGWHFALWTLCLGSVAGGVLGLIARHRQKTTIPYVPALAAGALMSAFLV
jgi:prepilin signal peptidase PulO-like enzyme (type II secretory pathway)